MALRWIMVWVAVVLCQSVAMAGQPNVLLILADDLGFSDLGCYGGEIETPVLDQLADAGLRYTQFYNTARCWPTRAAILTGYYPQQVGRDALPKVPGGARGVRPAWAQLLPRMLRPLGYRNYHSGKWHVDGEPIAQGFDRSLAIYDQDRLFNPLRTSLNDAPQPAIGKGTDYYQTTAIASHAIECLKEHAEKHSDQPFFHYLAFTCPHFPLHAPEGDVAKYKGKFDRGWDVCRAERWQRIQRMGLVSGTLAALEPAIGPPYRNVSEAAQAALGAVEVVREIPWEDLSDEQRAFQATKMEIHAAMVDRMDREIGRVVEQVKSMGAFEDTLILFLSDNGASAEIMIRGDGHNPSAKPGSAETYLCLGPGWSKAANTPFRRHKTWVHEGGIATPLIAHWPMGIKVQSELRHRVGHVVDLAPTIVELAGGSWPADVDGQMVPMHPGRSFVATFSDDQVDRDDPIWWLHEGNRAIRIGDYKLVAAKDEPWQLYNVRIDRAEASDLAEQLPEIAKELAIEWNRITAEFESLR